MATLMVLYGPPTDPEAFRRYYEDVHVPLAKAMPGATSLRYSFEVETVAGEEPTFAVFTADFASRDALDAALASPEGEAAQADVPNFATGSVTMLVVEA